MSADEIKVGRPYSRLRICAYECDLDQAGNPTKKSGQVAGWYGIFTPDRLQKEIVPKLAEHAAQGRHYPFLIITYQLEDKARVRLPNDVPLRRVRASDLKFSRRPRASNWTVVAIVNSATEYALLNG